MKLFTFASVCLCLVCVRSKASETSRESNNGPVAAARFQLITGDVVVFAGGTNMARAVKAGHIESLLTLEYSSAKPIFRDMAWDADTVFYQGTVMERWRNGTLGDWPGQLQRLGATVILAQYGQVESLAGDAGLADFVDAYNRLLDGFSQQTDRIVLISPTPFETADSLLPDLSVNNIDLQRYVEAIRDIAASRGCLFVDLFHTIRASRTERWTDNGMHISQQRQLHAAILLARQLGIDRQGWTSADPLRMAVLRKHRLWLDYWRPANWKCLHGDDSTRPFGRGSASGMSLLEEWNTLPLLIEAADKKCWQLSILESKTSQPIK